MARAKTSSFVTEVELLPTGKQAKKLRARFEAARQVYNACLGEILRRLDLMRQSKAWQNARKITDKKPRNTAFVTVRRTFGFGEIELKKWATQFTKTWLNQHIGANTVEAITSTAFKTAENYLFAGGKRNRPRFRRKSDLRSVDGRTGSDCHWKHDHIAWKGLNVPARVSGCDTVVSHGLQCPVKFVRLVRRVIRQKERFFAQLVCEGQPYCKSTHKPNRGTVGLDIGTQTIAIVGEHSASLEVFCDGIQRDARLVRKIQRALDRSRRAMNPNCFDVEGSIRRGVKLEWKQSRNYQSLQARLASMLRCEAEHRKNLHGQLVARVLKFGDRVQLEELNFQSFAKKAKRNGNKRRKRFGKSIGRRAPGMFVARLKQEAEKWGALVHEFPTKTTKLSQVCHCGHIEKKPLSQRVHRCKRCGAVAQRDLYSAFLARFVRGETLQADRAQVAWSDACAVLEMAWSGLKQANGLPSSLGLRARDRAACLRDGDQNAFKTLDDVATGSPGRESQRESAENRHDTSLYVHNSTHFPPTDLTQIEASKQPSDVSNVDSG